MAKLRIEKIDTFDKFSELKSNWDSLLAQSDVDLPFLTFEWITLWWKNFGDNQDLVILLVKENDQIVAIAPLMRKQARWRGVPVLMISFIANYHCSRFGFISLKRLKPHILEIILKYLKEINYKFDILNFDFVAKDSNTDIDLRESLAMNGMKHIVMDGELSPYIQITDNWDDYKKKRSSNFRHKLNQIKNRFEKHGKFEIIKYSDSRINEAMSELVEISKKTWKFKEKTAIANSKSYINLYGSLAELASSNDWLNIWILKIDNKPVSFIYNLVYKNKVYSLKIGFDEEYAKFSPGEFINSVAIKDAFDNKILEYDWLGENLPFKMNWTKFCRAHNKYIIFHGSMKGRILGYCELWVFSRLKKYLSINKNKLMNFFKKCSCRNYKSYNFHSKES